MLSDAADAAGWAVGYAHVVVPPVERALVVSRVDGTGGEVSVAEYLVGLEGVARRSDRDPDSVAAVVGDGGAAQLNSMVDVEDASRKTMASRIDTLWSKTTLSMPMRDSAHWSRRPVSRSSGQALVCSYA